MILLEITNRKTKSEKRKINALKSKGYTLLEVLVAITILTFTLGTVFQALSLSKRISLKSDETVDAQRILQHLLVDTTLMTKGIQRKSTTDDVPDQDGWSYSLTAEPLELDIETDDTEPEEINTKDKQPQESESELSSNGKATIPGMYDLKLCVIHKSFLKEKSFCISRWYKVL
ncbi:MAG: type II secretion system protein [Desulfobacterales bacterium]|nr:type II secretion system protein [Desulfobacterales bacterium]